MPDAVKISELPVLPSVSPNDIIPVVDEALTQTSRATASQIAAIGGGPPGDNTVTTAKLQNGAVTAAKAYFSATDKILGRASAGAGNGEEIPCTAFARGLLNQATAAAARSYLDALQSSASPTFTGTVTVNGTLAVNGGQTITGQISAHGGSTTAASYSFTGDPNCGMAQLGGLDSISLVTNGVERWRVSSTGAFSSVIAGGSSLVPHFHCRAWVNFNGSAVATPRGSGNVSSITRTLSGSSPYYVIAFSTVMPDTNYCVLTGSEWVFGAPYKEAALYYPETWMLTTSVAIAIDSDTVPLPDRSYIQLAIFR